MGALSWWHWLIVLLVLVVFFGSKRLPDAARGLGQSLRIFKSEVKEMQHDSKDSGKGSGDTSAANPRELPPSDASQSPSSQASSSQAPSTTPKSSGEQKSA